MLATIALFVFGVFFAFMHLWCAFRQLNNLIAVLYGADTSVQRFLLG